MSDEIIERLARTLEESLQNNPGDYKRAACRMVREFGNAIVDDSLRSA